MTAVDRDDLIQSIIAAAMVPGGPPPPKGMESDPVVAAVRRLAARAARSETELERIEAYLNRTADAVMSYAAGDLNSVVEPDGSNDLLDAVGTGLSMMAEELQARTNELAEARDIAMAANTAKSTFLANMSHELRTPLNAIIGYAELVKDEADEIDATEIGEDVSKILRAGRLLLGLISDVLDLSKVEAGRMDIELQTFSLGLLCREVVDTLMPLAREGNNRLELKLSPSVGRMHTDPIKLRQILMNLLSNALKFTRDGSVELRAEQRGALVRIEVSDNGIGIPADRVGAIFAPFTQVDGSTSRRFGGTGLGLAITRKFCSLLGGDISVTSVSGAGATFRVRLPSQIQGASSVAPTPQPPVRRGEDRPTVLVVDDDPVVHDLVRRYLSRRNYGVIVARSGSEGISLARSHLPTLITLDVLMPEMDGWTTLTRLKSDRVLAEIPVVMMSMVDNRTRGFALGASDYLVKPVERARLIEVVERFVGPSESVRILVVDDEPTARELARRSLEARGWQVREAMNGIEALRRLKEEVFDLVLLDLMMPEMDGFEVVEHMRSNPALASIPLVVLTAMDLTDSDRRRLELGVTSIIGKGKHSREELLAHLTSALDLVTA